MEHRAHHPHPRRPGQELLARAAGDGRHDPLPHQLAQLVREHLQLGAPSAGAPPGVAAGRSGRAHALPISAYVVGSGAASSWVRPNPSGARAVEAPAPTPPPAEQLSPVEEPSLPPPETAPVNTEPPTVSGSDVEGQCCRRLPGPGKVAHLLGYQWQDCNTAGEACTNIAKATSSAYKLTPTDVGHRLRVIVTAIDEAGSSEQPRRPRRR